MKTLTAFVAALALAACGETARLSEAEQSGPQPRLPPPQTSLIPTVKVAPATGWPEGTAPRAAQGLSVAAYAAGLDHPRWLYVLPNGDVLVAETAAPPRPEDGQGIKGKVMKRFMKSAGSAVPSANRITLLRDADGDGKPETRTVFL
ncbi:MAG TPA: sorbosone dehydrogenase family protein, partial [Burkholderiales bacterium]